MALPVAQLGYMPNMNAPSRGGKTIVEDPWAKIGQMVLADVAKSMVGNVMTKDYSDQAQTEGIVPNGGEAGDTPDNAPWYKKMITGPTMNERQYSAAQDRMAQSDNTRRSQEFTANEGQKTRDFNQGLHNDRILQEFNQFDRRIELDKEELAQRGTAADRMALIQGRGVQNDERRTDIAANPPAPQRDPDIMTRSIGQMASDLYKTRLESYKTTAFMAQQQGLPIPPEPTYDQAVAEASQAAAKYMNTSAPTAPTAPGFPLVDPSLLQFNSRL
jgi:hypothetical protein